MKKYLIIFLLISNFTYGKNFSQCIVYQYRGVDSVNKFVSLTQSFNMLGQLTCKSFYNYMEDGYNGYSDVTNYYFYKDTLLVKKTSINDKGDSTKVFYYYNKKKQLIKQKHFEFKRKYRKNTDDFRKKRTWTKTSKIKFRYNKTGQKILYDALRHHFSSQNRYIWEYDSLGRISRHISFEKDKLIWIEEFLYFENGYQFTRTWYDNLGTQKHLKDNWEYWAQYTFIFKTNEEGKIIETFVRDEKGEEGGRKLYKYNLNGLIEKDISYNKQGFPEITHLYYYN